MLPQKDLQRFAEACTAIGNELADDRGFVAIRRLLTRFHARLLIRPLLVEGMLATVARHDGDTPDASQWAVLVDSETYSVNPRQIEHENSAHPLPSRLRNTIAHELVHSLAFRPTEFGVNLQTGSDNEEQSSELIRIIERETERLSPLLLWPEKALGHLLSTRKQNLSVDDLVDAYRTMGISRYVLINRLTLLKPTDENGYLHSAGLRNLAIGIGEWDDDQRALTRRWPLFVNFDRNIVPALLLKIARQDRSPASTIIGDNTFAMCGGPNEAVELLAEAGTAAAPNAERIKIRISMESGRREPGKDFLFVVKA